MNDEGKYDLTPKCTNPKYTKTGPAFLKRDERNKKRKAERQARKKNR